MQNTVQKELLNRIMYR